MVAHQENGYLDFLRTILAEGVDRTDRTGVGARSLFDYTMRFDIEASFPLLTTKKVWWPGVAHELLWFLSGDTNIDYLQKHGVRIWNEWANDQGDLGPVYGHQWRQWTGPNGQPIDQIQRLIDGLKHAPHSRRHIVSAWNVGDLDQMALPPCHAFFQFYVSGSSLSCKLTQRSADAFLGVPFNIASYSLLTYLVAEQCGLKPKTLIWSGGDCHIYHNHRDQVHEQLQRAPRCFPELIIQRKPNSIFDYVFSDFELINYHPHPAISAPIAV